MNKKSYTYLFPMLLLTFFILSGCSANAKQTYLDAIKDASKDEPRTNEYSFTVTDIDFAKETDSSVKMGLSMLKDIEVSGVNTFDSKENISQSVITLDLMGSSMTLESLADEEYSYVSIDSLQTVYDLTAQMDRFGSTDSDSETAFFGGLVKEQNWQGKYVKTALNREDTESIAVPEQKDMDAFSQAITKEMYNYFKNMSGQKFKQKGDILTVELDKNDYQKLADLLLKTMHSKPEYEAAIASLIPGVSLDTIDAMMDTKTFSTFKKIDLSMTMNKKTKATAMTLKMTPKNATAFKSITIEFSSNTKEFEGTPELPTSNQIISETDFSETMSHYFVEKHYNTEDELDAPTGE